MIDLKKKYERSEFINELMKIDDNDQLVTLFVNVTKIKKDATKSNFSRLNRKDQIDAIIFAADRNIYPQQKNQQNKKSLKIKPKKEDSKFIRMSQVARAGLQEILSDIESMRWFIIKMNDVEPSGFQGIHFRINNNEAIELSNVSNTILDNAVIIIKELGDYGLSMPLDNRKKYREAKAAFDWMNQTNKIL
jgi:hypothetical protein